MIGLRCARLRAELVDFADGSLEEPARGRVERHVSTCPRCAEDVLALREVPAELARGIHPPPDERFWATQRRRIAESIDRGVQTDGATAPAIRQRALAWRAVPALAAAAVLIVVLGRGWMSPSAPQIAVQPPVASTPSDESLAAFLEEPAVVASVDVASLEDTTVAGMDESFEDTLAGDADGNLI